MGNAPLQRAERARRQRRARETARYRPSTARPKRGLDVRGADPYDVMGTARRAPQRRRGAA